MAKHARSDQRFITRIRNAQIARQSERTLDREAPSFAAGG